MIESVKAIEPKKFYNLNQITDLGIFSGVKSLPGCRAIIINDLLGSNILRTEVTGSGKGRAYKIKGANIIKFLESKSHDGNKNVRAGRKSRSDNSGKSVKHDTRGKRNRKDSQ